MARMRRRETDGDHLRLLRASVTEGPLARAFWAQDQGTECDIRKNSKERSGANARVLVRKPHASEKPAGSAGPSHGRP